LAAASTKLEWVQDALSAESHALKQGLILAQTLGCNRTIMASDCLEVVNMMQKGGYSLGIAAAVIDDCYHLATEFPKVIFEFCYREENSVASSRSSQSC
jgi:hypothetical protein